MALTYIESAALMQEQTFRGRVKVACLKFADSILMEATTVAAHNTRIKWANGCINNPDATAGQVTPPTVMDTAVQDAGLTTTTPPTSAISDSGLQGAVEVTVIKML